VASASPHRPVLRILAAFSRYPEAFDWTRRLVEQAWGSIELQSDLFDHRETNYYQATMGTDLKKTFFAFQALIDPGELPRWKAQTNDWEMVYQQQANRSERRPLNLDPGYLTEAKVVLASTKDRDHRIYLSDGIFAENTLYFTKGAWQTRPWTYPDYQRPDYHQFFLRCREYLRREYAEFDDET
jgi:hypothetical protein